MPLPQHTSMQQLAEDFGQFFIKKIEDIRSELNEPNNLPIPHTSSCNGNHLTKFKELNHADVRKLVMSSKTTSCGLDPIPTSLTQRTYFHPTTFNYKDDKPIPTDWRVSH